MDSSFFVIDEIGTIVHVSQSDESLDLLRLDSIDVVSLVLAVKGVSSSPLAHKLKGKQLSNKAGFSFRHLLMVNITTQELTIPAPRRLVHSGFSCRIVISHK